MEFEEKLSVIFLEFTKQTIDFDFFIDKMIELIENQREDGYWGKFSDSLIKDQNYLFLKIVHIYSITIFETFSNEFFEELGKEKNFSKKDFSTTPSKILDYFSKNFRINLEEEFKLWEELRENICRRNIITHNMGKIDQAYIDCIKHPNSNQKGKMIGIDIEHNLDYIKRSNDIIGRYIVFTFKSIAEFYNFADIKTIVKTIAEDGYFSTVNPDLLDDVDI